MYVLAIVLWGLSARAGILAALSLATFAWNVSSATGDAGVPVGQDYFGVNFQHGERLAPQVRALHLDRVRKAGITELRTNLSWRAIEREPPVGGVHSYDWSASDERIAAAARRGLRIQPTIAQTPVWAEPRGIWVDLQCAGAASRKPLTIAPYIELVRAIARRYGRGGTFWRQRPWLLRRPILRYEIWNEPNLYHAWCPQPEPELYAEMFLGASAAIRSVDPGADVVFGGLASSGTGNWNFFPVRDFLRRAIQQRPAISRRASSIGIHVYTGITARQVVDRVAWFRSELRAGGVPDWTPMLINEIGWPTRGGNAISESERTQAYTSAVRAIPRTNCNVNGVLAHAWVSPESASATNDPEHWWGIAHPVMATLYPSGAAFVAVARLMRGELLTAPPTAIVAACAGRPEPEPGGGGAGNGSTTSPPMSTADCTRRLTNLTRRIRSSDGQERHALRRKYRRVSRRCVPCKRRLATLRRKISRSEGAERARYRTRARQVGRRCRPCTRRLRRLERRIVNSPTIERRERLMARHQRAVRRCKPRRRRG